MREETRLEVKDLTPAQLVDAAGGDGLSILNSIANIATLGALLPAKKITEALLKRSGTEFADYAGLTHNKKNEKYAICFGYAVKKHFENEFSKRGVFGGGGVYATQIDAGARNVISPILLNDDILRQHVQIIGTTGSGKTQLLKGVLEQQIARGGGAFAVFGKADNVMLQQIYAVAVEYGREQDFFIVDWTATPEQAKQSTKLSGKSVLTNSINLFDLGSAQDVVNAMIKIAGLEDSDKWVKASKDYLSAVLRVLSVLNEAKLSFNIDRIDDILEARNALEELKRHYEELNFYTLSKVLTESETVFKLAALIEKIYREDREKFDKELYSLIENVRYDESSARDDIHNALKTVLMQQITKVSAKDIIEDIIEDPIDPFRNVDTSGGGNGPFYKLEVSQSQMGELITFYEKYALVLKNKKSDFDFIEAFRSGKIVVFNVPGQEREDAEIIGKMVIAILTLLVKKQGKAPKLEQTYLGIFDEINSWAKGSKENVFGLGDILSVVRGLGIAGIVAHQSSLDSMGKQTSEREQIQANINTKIVLKTESPEIIRELNELVGKREFKYIRDKRRAAKSESDTDTEVIEKEIFKKEILGSLWAGQGYLIRNKAVEKMITYYLPNKRYSALDEETIPITKTIDLQDLKNEVKRIF